MSSEIQSVIFNKNIYTKTQSEKWLVKHGFKTSFYGKGVDITDKNYRWRQSSPLKYKSFITKQGPPGIKYIIGYK